MSSTNAATASTSIKYHSSNATTPTSELSLSEDVLIPELARDKKQQHHYNQQPWNSSNAQQTTNKQRYNVQMSKDDLEHINSDYESSSAEDFESYNNIRYKNPESALLSYARTNKIEKLMKLLDSNTNLDINYKGQEKGFYGHSALHLACYFGHIDVVKLLLKVKNLNINLVNNSGETPLHKACLTNRVDICQLLLSNYCSVFIKNSDGLLAKEVTNNKHISDMIQAAEQVHKNNYFNLLFKFVDNGDLKKLQDYFENYSSYIEISQNQTLSKDNNNYDDNKPSTSSIEYKRDNVSCGPSNSSINEQMCQVTDDRGNTLLHHAAMRNNIAISVFLLEKGFSPYIKNNLGQNVFDLSSYKLRQLFSAVKPANNFLKVNKSITRFEGPLLKKVRILGNWKQMYVVLENGCFLLFNNRLDSMNKSRRGYKYLESAKIIETDSNDLGFTVEFSDKSKATFKLPNNSFTEQDKSHVGQLQLQKWIEALRDHIAYSSSMLKINEHGDEENENYNGDLSTLNHLLPADTIKSFVQEARAHYSILERHADSLCNLVQSITSSRLTNSLEIDHNTSYETNNNNNQQLIESQTLAPPTSTVSSAAISTGSRILGLIRPSRQTRGNSLSSEDNTSALIAQNQNSNNSIRKRNNSLTNEFIQDNWHCILFHLRLLMESTENTKVSMGQALALIEHQEQLRQNKIQDQEERCRVLEDSLHALARDHHQLEKSISMSQMYHSTMSIQSQSTDLQFFDAFEDFDDESRTITPNSSIPSDEDLNKKIQDVLDEGASAFGDYDNNELIKNNNNEPIASSSHRLIDHNVSNKFRNGFQSLEGGATCVYDSTTDDDEEDDLQSNCSALTVETVSDLLEANKRFAGLRADESNPPAEVTTTSITTLGLYKHR